MLSKKAKYAIKALIVLGNNIENPPLHVLQISEQGNIPKKYLESILLELERGGIYTVKREQTGAIC